MEAQQIWSRQAKLCVIQRSCLKFSSRICLWLRVYTLKCHLFSHSSEHISNTNLLLKPTSIPQQCMHHMYLSGSEFAYTLSFNTFQAKRCSDPVNLTHTTSQKSALLQECMLKKQVKTLEEMLKLNPEKVLAQRNASHNTDKLKIFSHWCLVKKLIAI